MVFVLTQSEENKQEVIVLDKPRVHLLPRNNLEYYKDNGLFEQSLINWCKQFCSKDKVFLDIGAHSGTYAITLAPYCKAVHCFEPQRMTYYSLCGGVSLSGLENVVCHQVGLGSKEQVGVQTLNIVSEDGGGSSLHTNDHKVLRTEQVQICTLDSLNLSDVGFIKMDVEENELYVLKGALDTLARSPNVKILFEYNGEKNETKGSDNLFYYIETKLRYNILPVSGYKNMYLATR